MQLLTVPSPYTFVPPSNLDVSVQDLAHLYAAHALDRIEGTHRAPGFDDAMRMHEVIDAIAEAAATGKDTEVAIRPTSGKE